MMRNVTVGLLLASIGAMPAAALDGPGRALVESHNRQIETKPPITSGNRSFIPPYSGTVRVKFDLKSLSGSEVAGFANVVHVDNCSKTTTSTAFVTLQCVLRVVAGYPVIISVDGNAAMRNVGLYYNVVDFDGKPIRFEVEDVT